MKVLITGAAGFVGGHLAAFLRAEHPGVEVLGLRRAPHGPERPGCRFVEGDLSDAEAMASVVARERPARIVHLAAQSSVHRSWESPAATLQANVVGLLNLLEGVRHAGLAPRVLVVGSAEEYGSVAPALLPIREDVALRPTSPYAVSKVAQGFVALQYVLAHGMAVIRTRTFQHTGPGRPDKFAESSFARQLAEARLGRREPVLQVGNLESVRDYLDVRDVVRAYWLLLEQGTPGEVYNVCSGRGVAVRDVLDQLILSSGLDVRVEIDPARLRPVDIKALVGDPTRLARTTGWRPTRSLDETLRDLLAHWTHVLRDATHAPAEAAH